MFRACELVVVNKIDLLPHLDVDLDRFLHNLDAVHPECRAHARQRADRARASTPWRDWLARAARGAGGGRACDRRGLAPEPCASTSSAGWPSAPEASDAFFGPRPSGSRGSATRWPSASRAAAG